jgi:hypothetical protein
MQASKSDLIQRVKALSLYKSLYKQLRPTNTSLNNHFETQREVLRNEFRQHSVSDSKYCMEKNEMLFLGQAYLTYLESTKRTLDLYARYAKGERSIEDSARIVGLKLPKLYYHEESKNKD